MPSTIFKSSRFFCRHASFYLIKSQKHEVIYIYLNDEDNLQSFDKNIKSLIAKHQFTILNTSSQMSFGLIRLKELCSAIAISTAVLTFYTSRTDFH
jgi:deoxyribodipyrimidine photolyase-related protein